MELSKFHKLISDELDVIIGENVSNPKMLVHKDPLQNRGYALFVWFLKFYGKVSDYETFITEGKDDNACDIILSKKSAIGEPIYYVIQSKYVNSCTKLISKEEFNATLTEFNNVLNNNLTNTGRNEKFNQRVLGLKSHLEKNGKAKFLFFTLAKHNSDLLSSVATFNKEHGSNVSLEIISLEQIRLDYIELKYKGIVTNPLEYSYNLEESKLTLSIERFNDNKRDLFEFKGRNDAYVFLLKPSMVHKLYEQYKLSLFFRNVRNPLHQTNYNKQIVETLLNQPDAFWYFNNGLTAIVQLMEPIGNHAQEVTLEGLQIINGAQTVYSVYWAYQNATSLQQKIMDTDARIMLRVIRSTDKVFNLQITRFTNAQNPMQDYDFWANDDVQIRLQNESFETDVWYEKRRGEFVNKTDNEVEIVQNIHFIKPYLAFHLQEVYLAFNHQNDFFISQKESKTGLYESIFNSDTSYKDLLVAYKINAYLQELFDKSEFSKPIDKLGLSLNILALAKTLFLSCQLPHYDLGRWLNNAEGQIFIKKLLVYTKDILYKEMVQDNKSSIFEILQKYKSIPIEKQRIEALNLASINMYSTNVINNL